MKPPTAERTLNCTDAFTRADIQDRNHNQSRIPCRYAPVGARSVLVRRRRGTLRPRPDGHGVGKRSARDEFGEFFGEFGPKLAGEGVAVQGRARPQERPQQERPQQQRGGSRSERRRGHGVGGRMALTGTPAALLGLYIRGTRRDAGTRECVGGSGRFRVTLLSSCWSCWWRRTFNECSVLLPCR